MNPPGRPPRPPHGPWGDHPPEPPDWGWNPPPRPDRENEGSEGSFPRGRWHDRPRGYWPRHGPFGPFGEHGEWEEFRGSPWGKHRHWNTPRNPMWQRRQRALFWRFAATFGAIMVLVVGGMATLALFVANTVERGGQTAILTWLGGCGLALALPMIGFSVATRASRDITGPLTDVMAAADAVAGGDLSVRVPEGKPRKGRSDKPGDFGQLARTFNHMVDELQRIDEQRRNLTADVAHELRTPLHIMQGNLEGILDGVYQPTPEHIQMLLDETRVLSRLIEDLRTLAMAESGHLILHKEPVQIAELLADLATSFRPQAEAAGIDLRVETATDSPSGTTITTIQADVMRLNQVLANLVVNALRYTPSGGTITLRAEVYAEADRGGGVRFKVSDTGQGIPAEDLP